MLLPLHSDRAYPLWDYDGPQRFLHSYSSFFGEPFQFLVHLFVERQHEL